MNILGKQCVLQAGVVLAAATLSIGVASPAEQVAQLVKGLTGPTVTISASSY
ncbi:hypothetical protein [Rathayibacter iranicus]|uniref:Serine protease n=1 Tax=Rathayibacter iranicus NCPPB 2253 = VKM Ac-1602 TaxID=1328868 RepID=A0ABX5LEM5_9MICO|nr:hypothetical protein [Rathayibacter iranicus]MWV31707.1 hypothetical protein [Rathayibacter iranicus NCPPB 2253 = VKM Ac-1602]PWJ63284.1 hypothetical protein B0H03_10888 [Rathayibacter iranicus NCPPB 2253 = VKM Ac-1602]